MNAILRVVWLVCKRNFLSRDVRTLVVHACRHEAFNTETRMLKRELMRRVVTFRRVKWDLRAEIDWCVERAIQHECRVLRAHQSKHPWQKERWRWFRLYQYDVRPISPTTSEED